MPYTWIEPQNAATAELHLWPHQSLRPHGYVRFIWVTGLMISIPTLAFLGSTLIWGLLPFAALALFGMKWALDRNRRDRQVLEVLTLDTQNARLQRINPGGAQQNWQCNRYWVNVEIHDQDGPVPHYVTLHGGGREVEIGAFLSEEERLALYDELKTIFRH